MDSTHRLTLTIAVALAVAAGPGAAAHAGAPPRLVLQITVDQLRGDLPGRALSQMDDGGFRYLYANGVVFTDARHDHANTETIVGHATLATGAQPSVHGMIGNVWFDRAAGHLVYNVEDSRYPLLTEGADVDRSTEIDPTQKTATSDGRSPSVILGSTFSDELALSTGGEAKIFGVSVKDRGAISMAGHAGKAFWFSKQKGEFVTSRYYYERYPQWVLAFNAARPAQRYAGAEWSLLHDRGSYRFGSRDDQPWETALGERGLPRRHGARRRSHLRRDLRAPRCDPQLRRRTHRGHRPAHQEAHGDGGRRDGGGGDRLHQAR